MNNFSQKLGPETVKNLLWDLQFLFNVHVVQTMLISGFIVCIMPQGTAKVSSPNNVHVNWIVLEVQKWDSLLNKKHIKTGTHATHYQARYHTHMTWHDEQIVISRWRVKHEWQVVKCSGLTWDCCLWSVVVYGASKGLDPDIWCTGERKEKPSKRSSDTYWGKHTDTHTEISKWFNFFY